MRNKFVFIIVVSLHAKQLFKYHPLKCYIVTYQSIFSLPLDQPVPLLSTPPTATSKFNILLGASTAKPKSTQPVVLASNKNSTVSEDQLKFQEILQFPLSRPVMFENMFCPIATTKRSIKTHTRSPIAKFLTRANYMRYCR